jgi:ribonuclease HII
MIKNDNQIIAGIDEVGRGPLAGPVVAACVHIPNPTLPWLAEVTDSKKLTKIKREKLDILIREHCVFSIAEISCEEIDRINILQATFRAMEQAACTLPLPANYIYVDGNKLPPHLPCAAEAVVKGDSKVKEIACASIIAKVYRDRIMSDLAAEHPHYGWDTNSGYGSKKHLDAILMYGVTPHHRRSFAPVRNAIANAA